MQRSQLRSRQKTTSSAAPPLSFLYSPRLQTIEAHTDLDQSFNNALLAADAKILRGVITHLYTKHDSLRFEIQKEFLVPAEHITEEPSSKKRKVSIEPEAKPVYSGYRYKSCLQCKEQFDTLQNIDKSCWRHSGTYSFTRPKKFANKIAKGRLDMKEGAFKDEDEVMEDPENDWRFHESPEKFTWSCCEGNGEAEACRVGRHNDQEIAEGRSVESELDSEEEHWKERPTSPIDGCVITPRQNI